MSSVSVVHRPVKLRERNEERKTTQRMRTERLMTITVVQLDRDHHCALSASVPERRLQ
jgi:hypothetical protein